MKVVHEGAQIRWEKRPVQVDRHKRCVLVFQHSIALDQPSKLLFYLAELRRESLDLRMSAMGLILPMGSPVGIGHGRRSKRFILPPKARCIVTDMNQLRSQELVLGGRLGGRRRMLAGDRQLSMGGGQCGSNLLQLVF